MAGLSDWPAREVLKEKKRRVCLTECEVGMRCQTSIFKRESELHDEIAGEI